MLFNSKPLIYLQLQDRSIRYVSVHAKNREILDKGEIIFENPILEDGHIMNESLLVTRLDALVKEKKWKNASAHLLLLNDFISIRNETVPSQLSIDEVRAYLDLHMNQSIRIPIDNPKFDFEVIDKNETEQEIYIVAYPGDMIEKYQEILEKVSLKPTVADLNPLSLYRIADLNGAIRKDENYHTLLLEWNLFDTSIMVFHQDHPTFNRHSQTPHLVDRWELSQQGEWVWNDTESELEMMLEEQINSLERFLDFYRYSVLNGEGSVSEIILTGNYPDLSQLKEKLTERFSITVKTLGLPEAIEQKYSALYGLTLKEYRGGKH